MSDEAPRPVLAKTTTGELLFYCPGCQILHAVWVDKPNPVTGAQWTWNGCVMRPTFSPSILIPDVTGAHFRCHSFVRDGVIEFCQDSQHRLSGKQVTLPQDPINQI